MNTNAFVRLIIVVTFAPVFGAFAQPAATNAPSTAEVLPDSSAYGEATVKRNIPHVAHPAPRQNFDLILPNKGGQPFPLIVWIHGGAWMM